MDIKNDNVATTGLKSWEQIGTIAIDFANYLNELPTLKGIDLQELLKDGWHQVGFRFGVSLIDKSDTLNFDIVLSKKNEDETSKYGYVSREVNKLDFLSLVVNSNANVLNIIHFENQDIDFKELNNIEE